MMIACVCMSTYVTVRNKEGRRDHLIGRWSFWEEEPLKKYELFLNLNPYLNWIEFFSRYPFFGVFLRKRECEEERNGTFFYIFTFLSSFSIGWTHSIQKSKYSKYACVSVRASLQLRGFA